MPKPTKRQGTSQQQTSKAKPTTSIPPPFTAPPPQLASFLEALDPAHVYITHIDKLPWQFKRKIFSVPLFLNLAIAALLGWRLYAALPTYLSWLLIVIGYPSPGLVDPEGKTEGELRWEVVRRALMVAGDFVLFRFLGFWPWAFFAETPVSPVSWRWRIGFRESEVVVRMSKQWGADAFWEQCKTIRGREVTPDNRILRERIAPAIDSEWMKERTGYMMMNRNYDLDLAAMLDAEQMIEKGDAKYEDFTKAVFIHLDGAGWCMLRVDEQQTGTTKQPDAEEQEARRRMELFRERLIALDKEHLFYRWVEMIQFESQQPRGLTPTRQEQLVGKARDLFNREGVDFDSLFASVGGADGFPGLGKD